MHIMLCPDDDANKDRVSRGLEYEDDSDSEYGSEDHLDIQSDEVEDIGNTSDM